MANIPQPPRSPLDPQRPESAAIWRRWFEDITKALKDVFNTTEANIFGWNSVNKAGSNIAQIETRNHNDLLNLKGSAEGYHLNSADYLAAVDLAATIALTGNVTAGLVVHIDPTDNGDGSLTLPIIQVNLFNNSTFLNKPATYSITGGTTGLSGIPALIDNTVNYIIVEYNAGSPKYNITTDVTTINWSNNTPYMTVYRDGTDLHTVNWCAAASGLADKVNMRNIKTRRFEREEGLALSESATRIANISSGIAWNGANRQSLNAFASNVNEWHFYKHVAGVWTKDLTTTQYNNTQYDDGTDLQTLVANRYTVNWIYRGAEQEAHAFYVLGNQQFVQLELAQSSSPPANLPDIITKHAFLVGRIIVQKNAATAAAIDSAFDVLLTTTPITDHGRLDGLADDDHPQYALLAGRSGGQSLKGGTAASESLTLMSTAHATKGKLLFGTSAYDEVNDRLGIGTASPTCDISVNRAINPIVCLTYTNATGLGELSIYEQTNNVASLQGIGSNFSVANWRNACLISASTNNLGLVAFVTRTSSVYNERMRINNNGQVGVNTTTTSARLQVNSASSTEIVNIIKGAASQSANLTEWQNSSAAVLSSVSATGVFTAPNYTSTVATGTQPYACTSTTLNTNHNSDLLDSQHGTYYLDRTNHTGITTNYNGIATEGYGHPAIVDLVALTAQTADITSTNFTNAGTAGLYRINYYLETTTADAAAGAVTLTVSFTDGAGATTVASSALTLTAVGRTSGVFFVRLASGSVAYATTHSGSYGTAAYALHAICERVN